MIKYLYLSVFVLIFSACSFKTPVNQWQYKSIAAFNSYTNNFLSDKDSLAKNDFNRAVAHSKVSANLNTLAKIYLGSCALNISVGEKENCQKYLELSSLVKNNSLDTYYNFVNSQIETKQIQNLPKNYQDFAQDLANKEFAKANEEILTMEKTTSKLLAATLLKGNIEDETISYIIELSSHHGYKKSVLYWLKREKERTLDLNKQEDIEQKISILNTKIKR